MMVQILDDSVQPDVAETGLCPWAGRHQADDGFGVNTVLQSSQNW
jgi:hypothetical protein